MADGVVGAARVKLHQALHGYADGHRELASSTQLKARDTKTMLILSDVSGSGLRIDEAGYLTGYPLADAGLYAFARTWAAPEMPRPGCVWTHTLLLDFADLARLGSITDLIAAFRRPQPSGYADYARPLLLDCSAEPPRLRASDELWARQTMAALYGKPRARVIASRDAIPTADTLVAVLWSQQWPRLRRSFRFCTLAAADRSIEGAAFDLQLLPPGNQAVRTRFPNTVEADSVSVSGEWLDEAVHDLMQPRASGLRSFIRQIGGDVSGGRAVFAPLCRLHRLITRVGSEPGALTNAIRLLQDELGPTQARAAHAIVAGAAVTEAERLDDRDLDYLLMYLDLIDPTKLTVEGDILGRAVLHRRPLTFASLVRREGPVGALAARTIASVLPMELTTALAAAPVLASAFLRERPELATEPDLWSRELGVDEAALATLRNASVDRVKVIAAMMAAGRIDLAHQAVSEAGPLDVLRGLAFLTRSARVPYDSGDWLRAAAQPSAVAELFARPEPLPRLLLSMIARLLGPDDMPNDFGEDPWLIAMRGAEGAISGPEDTHLRAFLLARSLGWRSRNQAELAQLGFEMTHSAAAHGTLAQEAWRLLDHHLPGSMLWFEWDRCQRMRAGIANLFVERELSPKIFGELVQDDWLFAALADQVARSSRGRRYLKNVRLELQESIKPSASSRWDFIGKLI